MNKDVPEWKSQGSIVVLSGDVLRDDNEGELSEDQRVRRQQKKERKYWKEFTDLYQEEEEGERALGEKASAIRERVEKTEDHLESLHDRLQDAKARENDDYLTRLRQSRRDTREHLQFLHLRSSVCEGVLWEIDRYGAPKWMEADDENAGWTARDDTTERAVAVLSAYNEQAHEVSKMKHLSKLLDSRGYGCDQSTRKSFVGAASSLPPTPWTHSSGAAPGRESDESRSRRRTRPPRRSRS